MRVDDDVRYDTRFREWHIYCRPFLGNDTFLTVTGGEFVADDGGAGDTEFDVDALEFLVARVGA